ncbi:hypothetical protein [Acinetobacter baumannii]|uniref:hypothetical protein n=1 Tax=Acinetobacter baumannii TaxID=470 RepID=UPI003AF9FEB3
MDAKDFKVRDKVCLTTTGGKCLFEVVEEKAEFTEDYIAIAILSPTGNLVRSSADWVLKKQVRHATPEEIKAGCRLDEDVVPVYANPQFAYTVLTGAQVGSVLQLAPQIDDMGDDSNLDHHVSPFCEVRDV